MSQYSQHYATFSQSFDECETPQEVKALYKKLIFQYHPDLHGEAVVEASKALNVAYDHALRNMSGKSFVGTDGKGRTYNYNETYEEAIREQLEKLIRLIPEDADIEIEIIGLWVWVTGDTYAHRATLNKGCGMTWHGKRKAWYWKPYRGGRSRYNPSVSLEDLAETYGGRKVERERKERKAIS